MMRMGPFKKYVRSEGGRGVRPKANAPYKIDIFSYLEIILCTIMARTPTPAPPTLDGVVIFLVLSSDRAGPVFHLRQL